MYLVTCSLCGLPIFKIASKFLSLKIISPSKYLSLRFFCSIEEIMPEKKKVLMICLGNICRSPIAEAVFIDQMNALGVTDTWEVESAALIGYHIGKSPDSRAMSVLRNKGISNYSHRARTICIADFHKFDWIFGMDNANIEALNEIKPTTCKAKVELLGSYDPQSELIIRDPYYDNNSDGFYKVYEQCIRSVKTFLEQHKDQSC